MLSILSLAEALAWLSDQTGRPWADSELFDIVTARGMALNSAVPITTRTTIQEFQVREGLVQKMLLPPGHNVLATVFPFQVAQVWLTGESRTSHPSDHDRVEGEYRFFTEPVVVTRAEIRIRAESLLKILEASKPGAYSRPSVAKIASSGSTTAADGNIDDIAGEALTPPFSLRAKDMQGLAGEIIREMLDAQCHDDLWEIYGLRADQAAKSLHVAWLSSLRGWDAELILEVAAGDCLPRIESLRLQAESSTRAEVRAMLEADRAALLLKQTRIARSVQLAMKAEGLPEIVSPAEGVLFLRRAGVDVAYELLEAVAAHAIAADTDDALIIYRQLLRIPETDRERSQLAVDHEGQASAYDETNGPKFRRQERAILKWLTLNDYDPKNLPERQKGQAGPKQLVRAALLLNPSLFTEKSFEKAWERLRADEEIIGAI